MTRLTGILCIIAAFALSAPDIQAQHHVIGSSWSFSGIGISYEYHKDTQTFAQVDIRAEMFDTFIGVSTKPGGSASFTWNIVFGSMQSRNDIEVRFYAGPGVAVGYAEDYKTPDKGLFFGLKGRVGMRCSFDRNVDISLALAPILGMHLYQRNEELLMRYYRKGFIQAIMPEIGIAYRF